MSFRICSARPVEVAVGGANVPLLSMMTVVHELLLQMMLTNALVQNILQLWIATCKNIIGYPANHRRK
jgi:hypothetical protein